MALKTAGFYKLIADEERKRMLGALLVVDELGKPEEFRVTYPVKPSLIQRQIYGDSLFPHVGMELCGLPLHDSLKRRPDLMVVSHPSFLMLGDAIPSPLVYLERAGETLSVKSNNGLGRAADTVDSTSGIFAPIRVIYPDSYQDAQRAEAATLVVDFFRGLDLLEPFNRIDVSVRVLQEQDEKFR
jgi:hypothetical protein